MRASPPSRAWTPIDRVGVVGARLGGGGADIGADALLFRVFERVVDMDADRTIVFSLSAEGTTSSCEHFFPSTVHEEGVFSATNTNADIDGLDNPSQWTLNFSNRFATSYLSKFIRSMERQIVTMRLSKDLPLILHFPLGGESESYVCFVLAAKMED